MTTYNIIVNNGFGALICEELIIASSAQMALYQFLNNNIIDDDDTITIERV